MALMDSSLGIGGPSPSELVSARTTCTSQPFGVADRMVCSPSGDSAQFLERAARSTTSSRLPSDVRSVNVNAEHAFIDQQLLRRDVVLSCWPGQFQLENAVLGVIIDSLAENLDA